MQYSLTMSEPVGSNLARRRRRPQQGRSPSRHGNHSSSASQAHRHHSRSESPRHRSRSSSSPERGRHHSRSPDRGRRLTRSPVHERSYTPFTITAQQAKLPHQRDLSPTGSAIVPKVWYRVRVRLSTENAYPSRLQMMAMIKAEVLAVFADCPRRLLRFQEDKDYESFIYNLVSHYSIAYILY